MSDLDVLKECDAVAKSIGDKASTNKRRARYLSVALVVSTAVIPLFLLAAELWEPDAVEAVITGKVIPAVLAVAAAVLARVVQFEQPHQRWTLYRRWNRYFEAESLRYRAQVHPYDGEDRDGVLAEKLAAGQLELDREWAGLIPVSSDIADRPSA